MPIIVGFSSAKKIKKSNIQSFILKNNQAKQFGLKKRNKNDILILSHITDEEYEQIKSSSLKNVVLLNASEKSKKSEQLDLGL